MMEQELFYDSVNPNGTHTIVLLHGLLSSHLEYSYVIPFLSGSYHLLVPDLPSHSRSSQITSNFTLASVADQLASLIRDQAHDGHAHLVGLSCGGFVALELAKRYPELVDSVFVSGAAPYTGWRKWMSSRPRWVFGAAAALLRTIPEPVEARLHTWQGLLPQDEVRAEVKKNLTKTDLITAGYHTLAEFTDEDVKAVRVRTLTVAGGQQDDVAATRKMGADLREHQGSAESRAVQVKGALHVWSLQFPEVFAKGVIAWVRGEQLPPEFEDLS